MEAEKTVLRKKKSSKVVTRFAPSITGFMHSGSLFNGLINYLYAKQNKGKFKIRLDGQHMTTQRQEYQDSLLSDCEYFGLHADEVLKQSDRMDLYKEKFEAVLASYLGEEKPFYFCDCTVGDISHRNTKKQILARAEKYPPPLGVYRLKAFDGNEELKASAFSSMEAPGFSVNNMVVNNNDFWKPLPVGFMGDDEIQFGLKFEEERWVSRIEIHWFEAPLKKYEIIGDSEYVSVVDKNNAFCFHSSKDVMFERNTVESICFSPVKVSKISIRPIEYMIEVKREYCYDRFCRDKNKELDLMDRKAIVRKVVNRQDVDLMDVVLWVGRQPDLCWTSALDDMELGITHCIRGIDIQPFSEYLEMEASYFVDKYERPEQMYHGMIVDGGNVKYSKFVKSPRIAQENVQKEVIFGKLAFISGIVEEDNPISLKELVEVADLTKLKTENMVWE